ncbi:MAG: hypothetical protein LBV42_04645 [Methanobrevibacter sp.]|nr:hypothetical protein [Methanobrevibacter sp.]
MIRRSKKKKTTKDKISLTLREIGKNIPKLDLPKEVKKVTLSIYNDTQDKGIRSGKSTRLVLVSSFYVACRQCNAPRSLNEIAEVFELDKVKLGRTYKILVRELNIKLIPTSLLSYIPRIADKLELSNETKLLAIEIINQAIEKRITSGKDPNILAAVAVHIASSFTGSEKTVNEIAKVVDVSTTSITKRYLYLKEQLGIDDSTYLQNLMDNINNSNENK